KSVARTLVAGLQARRQREVPERGGWVHDSTASKIETPATPIRPPTSPPVASQDVRTSALGGGAHICAPIVSPISAATGTARKRRARLLAARPPRSCALWMTGAVTRYIPTAASAKPADPVLSPSTAMKTAAESARRICHP